jgi:hypothetical protein
MNLLLKRRQIILRTTRSFTFSSLYKMASTRTFDYKVYVTQPIPEDAVKILKDNNIEPIINDKIPLDRKTLMNNVKDIDALYCTLNEKIDQELLDHASQRLKVIAFFLFLNLAKY